MKIVCIISPRYDYLTATLVEGLLDLGHEVIASENSNYATKSPDRTIRREAERADFIIVCSNRKVRTWLVDDVENPNKVYVDGSDYQAFQVYPHLRFKLIFKRELNKCWRNKKNEKVYPLPFAAEKRHLRHSVLHRDLSVLFAANLSTNTLRYGIYQRLLNREDSSIFCGNTGECACSKSKGHPIETPKYENLLCRSQIGVNVAGTGYDCARYWEVPASGALLFTQELDIIIPHPFTDGVNCVVFKTADEFNEKLDSLLSNRALVEQIAFAGHEHLVRYHTSRERAAYFLKIIAENIGCDNYCDSFYTGRSCHNHRMNPFAFLRK